MSNRSRPYMYVLRMYIWTYKAVCFYETICVDHFKLALMRNTDIELTNYDVET